MIQDTFFSMPRFVNLCRKDMVENWKSNVLRIVMLYGIMVVVMILNGCSEYSGSSVKTERDPTWIFLLLAFVWSLWGFGCLSASFTMEKMKSKTSRLSTLMIPATPFEKYISRWLICTIVFLVVFLLTFKLADYTRVLIFSLAYPDFKFIAPVDFSYLVGKGDYYTVFREPRDFQAMLTGYCFLQSCFVLGSSIWPKNSFLKTFAAGVVIVIIYAMVSTLLAKMMIPDNIHSPFTGDEISEELIYGILIGVGIIFTLFNWVLAYFRFKESEIINRL